MPISFVKLPVFTGNRVQESTFLDLVSGLIDQSGGTIKLENKLCKGFDRLGFTSMVSQNYIYLVVQSFIILLLRKI